MMGQQRRRGGNDGQGRPVLRLLALLLAALAFLAVGLAVSGVTAHGQDDAPAVAADAAHPCAPGDPDPAQHMPAFCAAGCLAVASLPQPGDLAAPPRVAWLLPASGVRPSGRVYAHFRPPKSSARI